MEVIVYSTLTCPKCKVLKAKLDRKGIVYTEEHDIDKMKELGIMSVPYLQIDGGRPMDFAEANKWVNSQED